MRALWLIDGSYIYMAMRTFQRNTARYANKGVDYKKLKDKLKSEFNVDEIVCMYFNSTPDPATDAQNAYHSWLKLAEPNGPNIRVKLYDLKEKRLICPNCQATFMQKVQKGVDVGIATAALRYFDAYDIIILSTGDGDFEDVIRFIVEDKNKRLYIVGFNGSISPDIQQYSSQIYLLNEHYSEICDSRDQKPFDTIDEIVNNEISEE